MFAFNIVELTAEMMLRKNDGWVLVAVVLQLHTQKRW
jgi:hypothetical protein